MTEASVPQRDGHVEGWADWNNASSCEGRPGKIPLELGHRGVRSRNEGALRACPGAVHYTPKRVTRANSGDPAHALRAAPREEATQGIDRLKNFKID